MKINFEQPNPHTLIVNGNTIEFEEVIATLIPFPDRIVVLLDTDSFKFGDKNVGQNLLSYGVNGEFLWRVEEHGMTIRAGRDDTVTQPNENGNRMVPQSIFEVDFIEKTGMIDAEIIDFSLTIDPATGKIIDMEYHR